MKPYTRLVQVILSTLSCLLVYFISKRIFNRPVGMISAFLYAVCGTLVFYEEILLSSSLTTSFSIIAIFLFIKTKENPSPKKFILGGIFLGLAILSQPNTILFLPFVLLWIFIELKRKNLKKTILGCGIILSSFIVTISLVTIKNYIESGKFILITTAGEFQFWLGNNEHSKGWYDLCQPHLDKLQKRMKEEGRNLYIHDVSNFIKTKPIEYIKLLFKKILLFWGDWDVPHQVDYDQIKQIVPILKLLPSFGFFSILGLTGMFLSLTQWRKNLLLYFFIFAYSFSVIIFLVVGRYRVPVIPPIIVFGGFTLYYLYKRLLERNYKYFLLSLVPLVFFSIMTNHQAISKMIQQQQYKSSGIYVETKDGVIIRDCSETWHGGNFTRLDSSSQLLKKELIITRDISEIKEVMVYLTFGGREEGSLIIGVNGKELSKVNCKGLCYPEGRLLRTVRIGPFSSTVLKRGVNTITIKVIENAIIGVAIDNFYNYGRSFFSSSNGGKTWKKIKGEYMIQLLLKSKFPKEEEIE
ncbi:MAG: glycosyltransferase family 39 protein [bacterium]|nr:glycosyltransferase family 39 protein [bacterium]